MRLIHTTFIAFCEFEGAQIPDYAVISHRWASDEISCQIFQDTAVEDRVGSGWAKIIEGCRMARSRKIRWLWIDTCCIDKRSSAELTESVNAMFKYYQQSRQCFVFLPDVHAVPADSAELEAQLSKSVWFTRGWTLQELLASPIATFYNSNFRLIGLKARDSPFCAIISRITGVGLEYLHDPYLVEQASVAERMRWASLRQTTRVEDVAYCLLGLFGVNMPLLYGEETKAFMRLQMEIIRKTEDESIYAWHTSDRSWKGLLAPSPASFTGTRVVEARDIHKRTPSTMTNKGLQLSLALPWYPRERTKILLPLNCVALVEDESTGKTLHDQIAIRIHVSSTLDAYNSGLRVLEGGVLSESDDETKLIFNHISNRMCLVGYTKAGRKITKTRYTANWRSHESGCWSAYGCANVVGVFPRASAGDGVTYPVYFKQDGV
ncbi:hypothetical protein BST61_g3728 [Cercospora zeina]